MVTEKPAFPNRSYRLNSQPIGAGPIIYWMYRDQRVKDNWALLRAQELARQQNQPLLVVLAIRADLTSHAGTARWFQPMAEGLELIAKELDELAIPVVVLVGDPLETVKSFVTEVRAGAVVCDFSPLRVPRNWQQQLASKSQVYWEVVDAHNCIPTWIASSKKEFAARTFRPKVHELIEEFLTDFPKVKKQPLPPDASMLRKAVQRATRQAAETFFLEGPGLANFLMKHVTVDERIQPVEWFKPGEKVGAEVLDDFLSNRLSTYATDRNDPTLDALSGLSPYLHFGMISAQRVILELQRKALDQGVKGEILPGIPVSKSSRRKPTQADVYRQSVGSFFEELVVRKELSDNFCFYESHYDSFKSAPDWAKETLAEHAADAKEFRYTLSEFEVAKTHDPAWNAAQNQMVKSGKMHGYMRMYWAKKILEWSKDPATAVKIAIELNDRYELDGRDPNGYVGILWAIGGVHDRSWVPQPIFGKVRSMTSRGLKVRYDIEAYISKWV